MNLLGNLPSSSPPYSLYEVQAVLATIWLASLRLVARVENNCDFLGWPASANVVWFDEKITNGPVLTLTSQIVGDTKVL